MYLNKQLRKKIEMVMEFNEQIKIKGEKITGFYLVSESADSNGTTYITAFGDGEIEETLSGKLHSAIRHYKKAIFKLGKL